MQTPPALADPLSPPRAVDIPIRTEPAKRVQRPERRRGNPSAGVVAGIVTGIAGLLIVCLVVGWHIANRANDSVSQHADSGQPQTAPPETPPVRSTELQAADSDRIVPAEAPRMETPVIAPEQPTASLPNPAIRVPAVLPLSEDRPETVDFEQANVASRTGVSLANMMFVLDTRLMLASGAVDRKGPLLWLWDTRSDELVHAFESHDANGSYYSEGLRAAAGGRLVVVRIRRYEPGGPGFGHEPLQQELAVWDLQEGTVVGTFADPGDRGNTMVLSPDGWRVLANGFMRDTADGRQLYRISSHCEPVFSPDGSLLATCVLNSVIVYDAANGTEETKFDLPEASHSLAFSRNGQYLAAGFHPGNLRSGRGVDQPCIRIWGVRSGKLIREFSGRFQLISSLAFSSDGRYLFSAVLKTISMRNLKTGRTEKVFRCAEHIGGTFLSPDDSLLVVIADKEIYTADTGLSTQTPGESGQSPSRDVLADRIERLLIPP